MTNTLCFTNGSVARVDEANPLLDTIRAMGFETSFTQSAQEVVEQGPSHVVLTSFQGLEQLFASATKRIFLLVYDPQLQMEEIRQARKMKRRIVLIRSLADIIADIRL